MQEPPSSPTSSQDIKQWVYYYQMLEEQQKYFTEQIRNLDLQAQGLLKSKTTMEELQGVKNGTVMIPIGSRALVRAQLVDDDKVLFSASKDVLIEKSFTEGIESMDGLLTQIQDTRTRIYTQLTEITEKLTKLRPEMERLYRASQGAPQ